MAAGAETGAAASWCGSGKLWCGCVSAGLGGRRVGACCGTGGDEFLHLSVWKQICRLQVLCLNLLLPTLPDSGVKMVVFLPLPLLRPRTGRGAGGAKSVAAAWAGLCSDARASAMALAVASAGLGQLPTALCPHSSICTPNVAPEVQAGCGERWSRCSVGYFTVP